jgi:hypothetical protein
LVAEENNKIGTIDEDEGKDKIEHDIGNEKIHLNVPPDLDLSRNDTMKTVGERIDLQTRPHLQGTVATTHQGSHTTISLTGN